MKTKELSSQIFPSEESKEILFKAIEQDRQLFKDTLELVLSLVVSDPKLIQEVSELIAHEYRVLYLSIKDKVKGEYTIAPSKMGCCKDFQ